MSGEETTMNESSIKRVYEETLRTLINKHVELQKTGNLEETLAIHKTIIELIQEIPASINLYVHIDDCYYWAKRSSK
jgi:hypothetical protein